MTFYAVPYRVLFHDTMAYGSHHFLTNLKFQCVAREHMFFAELAKLGEAGRSFQDEHIFLTQQGYARNLAPVQLGERVIVLVSVEDQGGSSATFCFRVIREDGVPVSAGFQVIVSLVRETGAVATSFPPFVLAASERIREPSGALSFRDRVLSGRLKEVFDAPILALAKQLAADPGLPLDGAFVDHGAPAAPALGDGAVFVFPGQGGFERETLTRLLTRQGATALLARIDAVGRRLLGVSAQDVALASAEDQAGMIRAAPDVVQLLIYTTGLLAAEALEERVRPAAMVGHSLGEITALAAAGALSVEDGAATVCLRCLALKRSGAAGGMLAVVGPEAAWRRVLDAAGMSPAVVNHDEQVVVSGDFAALEAVERAAQGVKTVRLRSPYPFHSAALSPAVAPLAQALAALPTRAPRVPVYSPLEQLWITDAPPADLGRRLAEHLVRPLDFRAALGTLGGLGVRLLAACGPGDAPATFARRVIGPDVKIRRLDEPAPAPAALPTNPAPAAPLPVTPTPPAPREAIAIVAAGSVLPGARGLDGLTAALAEGRVSLSDASLRDPFAAADFVHNDTGARPDKTYTLLGGYVLEAPEVPAAFTEEEAAAMSAAERMLAAALHECLGGLAEAPTASRTSLVLGSTADGLREHDEALLFEGITPTIRGAQLDEATGDRALERVRDALGLSPRRAASLAPWPTARRVGERLIGEGVHTLLVDAACASSLYAIDHGVRALRGGRCDLALCGGFFAAGPANACLFSQFRGLSPRGSRPLDADADGVVFGEGAVVLGLRRLADAEARGETILAVLREVGTSSDGWSASVALPGRAGQSLAMRRALGDRLQLDYLEAHATSTPVGDAVEYSAAASVLGGAPGPIELGSLKALIGHTGWAAGAASVLKIVCAWRAGLLPGQPSWTAPSSKIPLAAPFRISTPGRPWPRHADGRPRRAGVNGFGFGGSDAMVLLEEPPTQPSPPRAPPTPRRAPMAVIGLSVRLPGDPAALARGEGPRRLNDTALELPPGRPVLPDVLEAMDRSQRLAVGLAVEALGALAAGDAALREEIAVVLGVEGKTEASLRVNRRLYADRLRRALSADEGLSAVRNALLDEISQIPPSGPYTLPGLMPNVTAGRVSNLLDLKGPNMVLDAGADSLFEALAAAEQLLAEGRARIVLAGGLSAVTAEELHESDGRPLAEGAILLALTTLDQAEALGAPIRAVLSLDDRGVGEPVRRAVAMRGAEGALALADALLHPDAHPSLAWGRGSLRVSPPGADPRPIYVGCPTQRDLPPVAPSAWTFNGRRLVLLTDGPTPGLDEAVAGASAVIRLSPDGRDPDTVAVSSASDPAEALAALGVGEADVILTIVPLGRAQGVEALADRALLDLCFACARTLTQREDAYLGVLGLNAPASGPLPPETGLFMGLLGSVVRELPKLRGLALWTTSAQVETGLRQVESEWGRAPDAELEVIRDGDARRGLFFGEQPPEGPPPALTASSVVWLTGGARGITAVMAEALQRRYGCTVVLLGRSRLEDIPPQLLHKTEAELDAEEPKFYAQARAEQPETSLGALRARFERIRASLQVHRTLVEAAQLPGRAVYRSVDLTDDAATEAVAEALIAELGPPSLVVHGAGVQRSGALAKRGVDTFRQVVDTKLSALTTLHRVLAAAGHHPPFHLLTSAFSVLGNDGQPDYGAANLGMDRLADAVPGWSSIGWLGWASRGMTRGSEYLALARSRSLRPVEAPEGAALFLARLGEGGGGSACLLGPGELEWYRPALLGERGPRPGPTWELRAERWPAVAEHRVQGVPTFPGAFSMELAARATLLLRPGWRVAELRDLRFLRFLRVPPGEAVRLSSVVEVLSADADALLARVWLRAPIKRPNGQLLRAEEDHYVMDVLLRPPGGEAAPGPAPVAPSGVPSFDAFKRPGSPVTLGEGWPELTDVLVSPEGVTGSLDLGDAAASAGFVLPALQLDALCRISVLGPPRDGAVKVAVPLGAARVIIAPGASDQGLARRPARIRAAPLRDDPVSPVSPWSEVYDDAGRSLLRVEGGRARWQGLVSDLQPPEPLPDHHPAGAARLGGPR